MIERLRLSIELLLERRLLTVIIVDLLVLLQTLVIALVTNGEPGSIYRGVVILPFVLLGVPILANAVAIERRAGSLESVLVSPTAHAYVLRRYVSFCMLMALQGLIVMTLVWFIPSRPFPLPFVLFQMVLVAALLCAVSMFWGVYLKSSGAVIVASLVTLLALAPWFLDDPMPREAAGRFFPGWRDLGEWLQTNLVLALATLLFYLYARRRMLQTEKLLS